MKNSTLSFSMYKSQQKCTHFFWSLDFAYMRITANRWCHHHILSNKAYIAIWIAPVFSLSLRPHKQMEKLWRTMRIRYREIEFLLSSNEYHFAIWALRYIYISIHFFGYLPFIICLFLYGFGMILPTVRFVTFFIAERSFTESIHLSDSKNFLVRHHTVSSF